MEAPNKTEAIENEIIALLNKAEIDLNRSEFESLAESIIYYIDEIARRKKPLGKPGKGRCTTSVQEE